MNDYLCKCNNCGDTFIDTNPKTGAVKLNSDRVSKELELIKISENTFIHGCPNCRTDEYITDLP